MSLTGYEKRDICGQSFWMPVIMSQSVTIWLQLMQTLKCEESDEAGWCEQLNVTVVIII